MFLFGLSTYILNKLSLLSENEKDIFDVEAALAKLTVEIRTDFISASNYIRKNGGSLSNDDLLYLYGLYKMVTVGPTNFNERPAYYNLKDRLKWQAWHDLSDKTQLESANLYILKVENSNIGWKRGQKLESSSGFGVRPSHMLIEDNQVEPSCFNEKEEAFLKAVRDGSVHDLTKQINEIDKNIVQCMLNTHFHGLTPLHWAADRGNLDIIKKLLELSAPINAFSTDEETNTPLHLAAITDNVDCAKMLIEHGADHDILDADGKTALDYAESNEMKNALGL